MPETNHHDSGKSFSNVIRLFAFVVLVGTGLAFLAHSGFDLQVLLRDVQSTKPLHFVGLMSLLPLAGFPISAFYLYAGSAYVWWKATLLCSMALAINMALAYPLAKSLLKNPVSHFMARYRKQLPNLNEHNQFRITFLVRSIPGVPFFMQNYMLPLIGVRFSRYFIISWSIQTVFAAGMASLPHLIRHSGWIPAGIIAALVILLLGFRRIYVKDHPPGSP